MAIDIFLIPTLGFFIGIIASMLGIGGGIFLVPLLQLLPLEVEFYPTLAAGTTLTMVSFKALSSTYGYAKQRRIDYKVGLLLAATAIPGSFAGAFLTDVIARLRAHELLQLTFTAFLVFIATRMIFPYKHTPNKRSTISSPKWRRQLQDSFGNHYEYAVDLKTGVLLGFFAGVSSGLLGIGGGSLMVPILVFTLSFPMHLAIATSVFVMVFTSISGVVAHGYFEYIGSIQHIDWSYALLLSLGVIVGAQIGTYASQRVSANKLRRVFGVVLAFVSLRMVTLVLFGI